MARCCYPPVIPHAFSAAKSGESGGGAGSHAGTSMLHKKSFPL